MFQYCSNQIGYFVPPEATLLKRSETSFGERLKPHLDDYAKEKAKKLIPMIKKLQQENRGMVIEALINELVAESTATLAHPKTKNPLLRVA